MEAESLKVLQQEFEIKYAGQPLLLQSVHEILKSVYPLYAATKRYVENNVLRRLLSSEQTHTFSVESYVLKDGVLRPWTTLGGRCQWSSLLGPYKGGLRFEPRKISRNDMEDQISFLGLDQTIKDALSGFKLGGAKGILRVDPSTLSDPEWDMLLKSFARSLARYIGEGVDVPAGDQGVGSDSLEKIYRGYNRLKNGHSKVFTGQHALYGGIHGRNEATGYGLIYFLMLMLEARGLALNGMNVNISGAGNVALNAALKVIREGGVVRTFSDRSGTLYSKNGFTGPQVKAIRKAKELRGVKLNLIASRLFGDMQFFPGERPWHIPCDIALPCATQHEIHLDDAIALVRNGCQFVVEGANMPTDIHAQLYFYENDVEHVLGWISNIGGVGMSAYEMVHGHVTTGSEQFPFFDDKLKVLMKNVYNHATKLGVKKPNGLIDYTSGGMGYAFKRLAEARILQGVDL